MLNFRLNFSLRDGLKKMIFSKQLLLVFLFSMSLLSCSKKGTEPSFDQGTGANFGVKIKDTLRFEVDSKFNFEESLKINESKEENTPLLTKSSDIFRLSEYSIQLGQSGSTDFTKFGHSLLELFYTSDGNTTQFNKSETLYLPAALGSEGEKIQKLFTSMGDPKNVDLVSKVFECKPNSDCLSLKWPDKIPTLEPIEFVLSIKNYLRDAIDAMNKSGVSKEFVGIFTNQVTEKYIEPLSASEEELKSINENTPLLQTATVVLNTIQNLTFLPAEKISVVLKKLDSAKVYGELLKNDGLDAAAYASNIIKVIANVWLDLNPEQRINYVKSANPLLYEKFSEQSDNFIQWLAGRTEGVPNGMGWIEWISPTMVKNGYMAKLKTSCHANVRDSLLEWVKLGRSGREKFKVSDQELYSIFNSFSNDELVRDVLSEYKVKSKEIDTGTKASKDFVSKIELRCLDGVAKQLSAPINKFTLTTLDEQIRKWGPFIQDLVGDNTKNNIKGLSENVQTDEGFLSYFDKMAMPVMNKLLFKDKSLPGLERTDVALNINTDNTLSTSVSNLDIFETGAETLGTSLSANYYRFLGLEKIENKKVDSDEYTQVVFAQINKMLSIIGFTNFDRSITKSLHRNFSGGAGESNELDVYKYDCSPRKYACQKDAINRQVALSKDTPNDQTQLPVVDWRESCSENTQLYTSLYHLPDRIAIEGPFAPASSDFSYHASALGQAELIRGASLMIKYFQDWKSYEDDYDRGMGKKAFNQINIFPKQAFVNLTVGLASVPVRGFKKPNSSIRLFGNDGKEKIAWAEKLLQLENQDTCDLTAEQASASRNAMGGVAFASVSDIENKVPSDVIKAQDLATMILALDEFIDATSGIGATKATAINPKNKAPGEKGNLAAVEEGRELLSKMMYGMFSFLQSKLQDSDRGFNRAFDLSTGLVLKEKPRTTTEQLYVIEALLRIHKRWGAESAARAAIEAYYFMNKNLWDSDLGFYKLTQEEAPLVAFTQTLHVLELLEPYIQDSDSKRNLVGLLNNYRKEYQNWIAKILH